MNSSEILRALNAALDEVRSKSPISLKKPADIPRCEPRWSGSSAPARTSVRGDGQTSATGAPPHVQRVSRAQTPYWRFTKPGCASQIRMLVIRERACSRATMLREETWPDAFSDLGSTCNRIAWTNVSRERKRPRHDPPPRDHCLGRCRPCPLRDTDPNGRSALGHAQRVMPTLHALSSP